MNSLPESTVNLLLSGLMGAIGGLITIPVNAYIMWKLKRDELYYQHKLELIASGVPMILLTLLSLNKVGEKEGGGERGAAQGARVRRGREAQRSGAKR